MEPEPIGPQQQAAHQQEFDFTRGSQLAMLREARLPTHMKVSGMALKAVLKAIDDFGRGRPAFAGRAAIARCANLRPRQVSNAIAALLDLSLIVRERQRSVRGRPNQLRIVWTELAVLCQPSHPSHPATVSQQTATMPLATKPANPLATMPTMPAVTIPNRNFLSEPATMPERVEDREFRAAELGATDDARLGATAAPLGAMRARLGAIRRPPYPLEALETNLNRLLLPPRQETPPEGWQEVENLLRSFGLGTAANIVAAARQHGQLPSEFGALVERAIATARLPANAQRLSSPPGAVAHFLATGNWPCSGIIDLDEAQRREQRRQESQAAAADQAAAIHAAPSAGDVLRALEAQHGAALDALPPAERAELEREALGPSFAFVPPLSRRLACLRKLAARLQEIAR